MLLLLNVYLQMQDPIVHRYACWLQYKTSTDILSLENSPPGLE